MYELAVEADDADTLSEAIAGCATLSGDLERLELSTLLSEPHGRGELLLLHPRRGRRNRKL